MIPSSKKSLRLSIFSWARGIISSRSDLGRQDSIISNLLRGPSPTPSTSTRWSPWKIKTLVRREKHSYKPFKCTSSRPTLTRMQCSRRPLWDLITRNITLPMTLSCPFNRYPTCEKKDVTKRACWTPIKIRWRARFRRQTQILVGLKRLIISDLLGVFRIDPLQWVRSLLDSTLPASASHTWRRCKSKKHPALAVITMRTRAAE